ncbi:MAG: hypothetical protein ACFFBP_04690 [Promethearchaeota archaeon]
MTKKYKHYDIIKFLVIIGGIVGIFEAIDIIIGLSGQDIPIIGFFNPLGAFIHPIAVFVACIIGAVLALVCGIKPDDPIPFHWIVFLIFAIWLIICSALIGGVLCLIAFLIGLIDDL